MIKQKLLINTVKYYKFEKYFTKHQALPIQQKIQFEVSEIPCVPWNSILGCTYPTQAMAHLVIVLVSRMQKSGTGQNNFVKWKGTFWSNKSK